MDLVKCTSCESGFLTKFLVACQMEATEREDGTWRMTLTSRDEGIGMSGKCVVSYAICLSRCHIQDQLSLAVQEPSRKTHSNRSSTATKDRHLT